MTQHSDYWQAMGQRWYSLQCAQSGPPMSFLDAAAALRVNAGSVKKAKDICIERGLIKPRNDVRQGAFEIVSTGELKVPSAGKVDYSKSPPSRQEAPSKLPPWTHGIVFNDIEPHEIKKVWKLKRPRSLPFNEVGAAHDSGSLGNDER